MAEKPFEPDDPMLMSAAAIPAADTGVLREMARCFAEEYLQMGWDPDAVMEFFRNPFYRATHQAYLALGREAIAKAIQVAHTRARERRPGAPGLGAGGPSPAPDATRLPEGRAS